MEDLRLEKHANKEATKVSMQAAHCQDNERLVLQKQVTQDPPRGQGSTGNGAAVQARDSSPTAQVRPSWASANSGRSRDPTCPGAVSQKAGRNRHPDDKPGRHETTVGRAQRSSYLEAPKDGGQPWDHGPISTHRRQRNLRSPSEANRCGSLRYPSSPAGKCHGTPPPHHLSRECTESHREGQHRRADDMYGEIHQGTHRCNPNGTWEESIRSGSGGGMRRQQLADQAAATDGVIFIFDSDAEWRNLWQWLLTSENDQTLPHVLSDSKYPTH